MATVGSKGNRSIDRDTVKALARYAGLNLPEDRVVAQLEFLKTQVDFLNEVDRELKLGFQLDDDFHVVPPAYGIPQSAAEKLITFSRRRPETRKGEIDMAQQDLHWLTITEASKL